MIKKNKVKFFLFSLLFLFSFINKSFSEEEFWWCEKNIEKNVTMMIPVKVIPYQKQLIFLDKINVNGILEESSHKRHDFKLYNISNESYSFEGKWGKSKIKGVLYNSKSASSSNQLIYTIDEIGTFKYPCKKL